MTNEELQRLRATAKAYFAWFSDPDLQMDADASQAWRRDSVDFRAAFNEPTVLALLDEIARLTKERDEARVENDKLRAGIVAVHGLILESAGVAGLHRNGDVAEWDDLRTGGRYEEWLIEFDDALNAIDVPAITELRASGGETAT